MRMCGHAHHDDMLYLGKDPQPSWDYPPLTESGYADRELYEFWRARDPIATYAAKLEREGVIEAGRPRAVQARGRGARRSRGAGRHRRAVARCGDRPASGVLANEPRRVHIEVLDRELAPDRVEEPRPARMSKTAPPFDPKGKTFLEAVMLGVGDALRGDPRMFVYGEDVGGKYGNAFLLLGRCSRTSATGS